MIFARTTMLIVLSLSCILSAQSDSGSPSGPQKVLLVYDDNDTTSAVYIKTMEKELDSKGFSVTKAPLDQSSPNNLSSYEYILVHSRVMAFNMMSSVRKWLKQQKDLNNQKILIFTTAAKWFQKKNMTEAVKIIRKRGGDVVDAVSMATGDWSKEQKVESVEKFIGGLK
ncbi:MAG: hypothetical protein GF401_19830 [Chitinivibrionales bacterium]|nr:hypothetical protein [Chitinivibrionales bacterium]